MYLPPALYLICLGMWLGALGVAVMMAIAEGLGE